MPDTGTEHWLDGAPIGESAVLFVVGLGDGHLLTALDRRGWRGRVVALEPAGSSPLAPSSAVTILLGPDYAGLDAVLAAIDPDREQPVVVGDPAVLQADRDEAVRVSRLVVRAWFGARANQEARRKYAGPYLRNTLRNLPTIAAAADAAALVQAFPACPAVIVAAGPSLDAALPEIAAWRDRGLLIAVDTALRPLLGAGIEPDLVVALDPSEANASHLVDLPDCPHTWLVGEGSLDPEAFGAFVGRTCVFRVANHHPWPWLRQHGLHRHHLRAWGSVLTTAFDLALQMGCDPIVFTGADLAFTAGQPYARGTTFEEEWRRARAWGESLDVSWAQRVAAWPETCERGVDGAQVRTAPHLCAFRDWIVAEAARVPERTVINATGAGILTGSAIRQMTLADAVRGRPVVATDVRAAVARWQAGCEQSRSPRATDLEANVRAEWAQATGLASEAVDEALLWHHGAALASTRRLRGVPQADGAVDADTRHLAELAQTTVVRRHRLIHPNQDLLAELRDLTRTLGAREAVAVIDEVGVSAGAQVRQAVSVLLCERPDLWVEYRRIADHQSRLTVLRGGAGHGLPAFEADHAKWDADQVPMAAALVPTLVRELTPTSVIDLGCGAGYWLQAFAASGVTDVHGVTARMTALDAVPDLGRRFDLCLCLEVVQYVPPERQDAVIATCTRASDVVVFSSRWPGAPGASPYERPLAHWAALFQRHGFVLEDRLRPVLERHADIPRSVFEMLVTFRRQNSPGAPAAVDGHDVQADAAVMAAMRLDDLYTQRFWWAVSTLDRIRAADIETPRPEGVPWPIPPARLLAAADGARVFRFRTGAARWYVTHPASTLEVCEAGVPLPAVTGESVVTGGGWSRWRDEIRIWSSDGSDPRTNRRCYALTLPPHVAWAETQSLRHVLRDDL